jgi:hypothetical protein
VDGAEYELVVGDGSVLAAHRYVAGVRPTRPKVVNILYYKQPSNQTHCPHTCADTSALYLEPQPSLARIKI